ncbi:MAG: NAD(P)-dependent glycerol-3-phosphate dehydrogenase [Pseudomonadota bacterium]|nr:NAD(P)-dependent glycerol-3-phosphate dehydrogenase [Pseudomonadota bacterium]
MTSSNQHTAPIVVTGAGSWGTALAILLATAGRDVRLWGRDPLRMAEMASMRINAQYLPDCRLPDSLLVTADLAQAFADVKDVMIVVPSHAFREHLTQLLPHLTQSSRLSWSCKGLDQTSGQLLSEVVAEVVPWSIPMAILSGPSFAKEVARGLPTAAAIASSNSVFAHDLVAQFHTETFRPYLNPDIIGVQISGAVKNPIAIAAGISDGLGYGANARSALITRALAEMTRLGIAMGGKAETFVGLAGLGDLVLTCTSDQSRNFRFGHMIGEGKSTTEAEQTIAQVIEGLQNAFLVEKLAKKWSIEMPIIEQVCEVLRGKITAAQAVHALFERSIKPE